MATFNGTFTCDNTVGTLYFKIKYRLTGSSTWTSFNIPTSGTTYSFTGTNNLLYDVQIVNVNGSDNPSSSIAQSVYITDPNPLLSPTNTVIGFSFSNLSYDMDTYTCTIALYSSPGSIISTQVLPAGTYPNTVSGTFTGLSPLTKYTMTITPAANQFSETFTYTFTTEEVATCAAPTGATATLV